MDWKLFFQLAVTAIVAFAGAWVGHQFSAQRDLLNERRKLRVSYLLEAYRRLEDAGNRADAAASWSKVESAVADIQLLGSPEQVQLARKFALAMARDSAAPLNELLLDLRRSLRTELDLPNVAEPVAFLRFSATEAPHFDETLKATARNIGKAKLQRNPLTDHNQTYNEAASTSNVRRIESAWKEIEQRIIERLVQARLYDSDLEPSEIISRAFDNSLINAEEQRSLTGLHVMRNLALVRAHDKSIDDDRTTEFLTLVEAMKSILDIDKP